MTTHSAPSSNAPSMTSDLMALLEQAKAKATEATEIVAAARSHLPPEGSRISGYNEERDVEVVLDPRMRIVELNIDDALISRHEDTEDDEGTAEAEHDDAPEGLSEWVSQAVMAAYGDAWNALFDPDKAGQISKPAETPAAPERRDFPRLAYVEPGQWPDRARYEQWAQLHRRADEVVAAHRERTIADVVEGHDDDQRVVVTTTGAGILRSVSFNERWLDGVGGRVLASSVQEALDRAYAEIDAPVRRQEVGHS